MRKEDFTGTGGTEVYKRDNVTSSFVTFSEPPQIAPFSFASESVDEGSFAQITCSITKGDEPLKISWHLHGDVVSSEPGTTTTMIGSRTSLLLINSVGYRHSGLYTCRASNPAGSTTHAAELKVNGRNYPERKIRS